MALAAEAALTAVELLDAGWSRLTRSKTRSQQAEEQAALEERALTLEGELAKEKVEARKLQAAIEEYKNLLLKVHQDRGLSFDLLDNAASSEAGTAEVSFTLGGATLKLQNNQYATGTTSPCRMMLVGLHEPCARSPHAACAACHSILIGISCRWAVLLHVASCAACHSSSGLSRRK